LLPSTIRCVRHTVFENVLVHTAGQAGGVGVVSTAPLSPAPRSPRGLTQRIHNPRIHSRACISRHELNEHLQTLGKQTKTGSTSIASSECWAIVSWPSAFPPGTIPCLYITLVRSVRPSRTGPAWACDGSAFLPFASWYISATGMSGAEVRPPAVSISRYQRKK
jgi:hypothetical protein